MKRPTRTIKRESELRYRGRSLILIVPPICDVVLIREKGRRTAYEVSVLDLHAIGAKRAAEKRIVELRAKRKAGRAS